MRRALDGSGDVGAVAFAAKHGTLAELESEYGTPIGFMLAAPIPYGDAYADVTRTRVAHRGQVRRHSRSSTPARR